MRLAGPWAVIACVLLVAACGGSAHPGRGAARATAGADRSVCVDSVACRAECDAGRANACTRLGRVMSTDAGRPFWFRLGCRQGDAEGCARAIFVAGTPGAWEQACEQDVPEACEALAWAHVSGEAPGAYEPAGRALYAKASRLYLGACAAGSAIDCRLLGEMAAVGLGVPRDDIRAGALFEHACDLGDRRACVRLGELGTSPTAADKACSVSPEGCTRAGLRRELDDPARSVELYRESCVANYGHGCDLLGFAYEAGIGVERDDQQAARYYQQSCQLRDAHGCYDLARAHIDGRGVRKDPAYAAALLETTCGAERDGLGCDELIALYEHGLAEPPASSAATDILAKQCDKGDGAACARLGDYYARGKGVGVDGFHALELYLSACEAYHAPGCVAAATLLDGGDLVPKDRPRATRLYRKACELGDAQACQKARP